MAGPCQQDIIQAETALDQRLNSAAAAGGTATESHFATMHRQPTPGTVAGAEERLGDLPPAQVTAANRDLDTARKSDAAGDAAGCQAALDRVRRVLGP